MDGTKTSVLLLFLLLGLNRYLPVKAQSGKIHIEKDDEARLFRCEFPDNLPLTLEYNNRFLDINLNINNDVSAQVPIYIMSTEGKAVKENVLSEEFSVAYHDKSKMAAIVITCSKYHQGKRPYILEGKLIQDGRAFNIEPVRRHRRDIRHSNDYLFTQSASLNDIDSITSSVYKYHKQQTRQKRNAFFSAYLIDVLVVTDYTIYDNWFKLAPHPNPVIKRLETLVNIRKYYTVTYNWVNLIFQNFPVREYNISVFITGFIISENKATSILTEPYRNGKAIWGLNVLRTMASWLLNSEEGDIPPNDHVQLFSRMDFTADEALAATANKGQAYTSGICSTSRSVSYVEELGGFNSADIAAHELTHSFGSGHDGDGNLCNSQTGNLMAAYFDSSVARLNLPSSCTLYDIRNYLRIQKLRNPDCILERLSSAADVPEMGSILPGMVYDADAQCQQVHGPLSFHCRNLAADHPDDFCFEDLSCYDPIDELCHSQVPALGTPCANKSWCMDTKCMYDDKAPERDGECLFGDLPVGYYELTESGESCQQRVLSAPYSCYDEFFSAMCCYSCTKIRKEKQDCQYGDYKEGCYGVLCGRNVTVDGERVLYDIDCCETCAPPTTTTTTTTAEPTTTKSTTTTVEPTTTRSTTTPVEPTTTRSTTTTVEQTTTRSTTTTAEPTTTRSTTTAIMTTTDPTTTRSPSTTTTTEQTTTTTEPTTIMSPTTSEPKSTTGSTTIRPHSTTTTSRSPSATTTTEATTTTTTSTTRITLLSSVTPTSTDEIGVCSGEDKYPSECSMLHKYGADCSAFLDVCCETCGQGVNDDGVSSTLSRWILALMLLITAILVI